MSEYVQATQIDPKKLEFMRIIASAVQPFFRFAPKADPGSVWVAEIVLATGSGKGLWSKLIIEALPWAEVLKRYKGAAEVKKEAHRALGVSIVPVVLVTNPLGIHLVTIGPDLPPGAVELGSR